MTEETEAVHAQVTASSPEQTHNTELNPPKCVVERYVPSAENWAKIKPRILEMEKAFFQDRTKDPPTFYGFEDGTLDKLFTNNDGTRHILLLKMGEKIVGWISARPLGYKDHIKPLTEYNDPEDPQYADGGNPFVGYYKGAVAHLSNSQRVRADPEQEDSIPEYAYISHIVIDHRTKVPSGSAAKLERAMFARLRESNYNFVSLDAVVATKPGDDPEGYAGRFASRHKDKIKFNKRHHAYADADPPLPEQIHVVVKTSKEPAKETVQDEHP